MDSHSFFPYGKPSILPQEIESMAKALSTPIITRGPLVETFEKTVANYCGASFAVAFNSGSSALSACAFAAQIKEGDKIISTPNTFVASVGTAVQKGASPVFVDIDRSTGNLDTRIALSELNVKSTRSKPYLVAVHFAGIACDMKELSEQIKNPEAIVVEDACHALGSCYPSGERVGSCDYSDMTVFSFHPVKTITTGEGGMVTTNREDLYQLLKLYRDNGIVRDEPTQEVSPWLYDVSALSGNYHFTEFQAALGLSQMERLESFIEKRRQLMACYRQELSSFPHVRLFKDEADERSAYHICVVQIDFAAIGKDRSFVMRRLKERGVGTQVHYIPLYRHSFFQKMCGDIEEYFPQCEAYYSQALTLPLYFDLTSENVKSICKILKEELY